MKYNINNTINDFEKFIEFNEIEKSILTAQKGVLGKKDSFKLNELLIYKKDVEAPTLNQDKYPVIEFMFTLALDSKLYIKGGDEKGKLRLIETDRMESYKSLNKYEKYIFLLQTFWTKYKFKEKFGRWVNVFNIYNTLDNISESKEGDRIIKYSDADTMFSEGAEFFHQLKFFGFGEIELIDGAKGKYEDSIKAFLPNEFGIEVIGFLVEEALIFWGIDDLELLLNKIGFKMRANKDEAFERFQYLFADESVNNTVDDNYMMYAKGVYTFKVSLSKTVWRKISLSHTHTLGDLHNSIQQAFNFDNDHLYVFYIGGNRRTGMPVYCEYASGYRYEEDEDVAENTTIASLDLYEGERMVYLFDFGDEWEFNLELINIDEEAPLLLKPIVVEEKGKSPS